jgi:hypothetical protein
MSRLSRWLQPEKYKHEHLLEYSLLTLLVMLVSVASLDRLALVLVRIFTTVAVELQALGSAAM